MLKNSVEAFPFALNFVNESISLTIFPSNLKNWKQKERRILANGEMLQTAMKTHWSASGSEIASLAAVIHLLRININIC